jgi:hypothetical protein
MVRRQTTRELRRPFASGVFAVAACSSSFCASDADLILSNAKIITVDHNFSIKQAVAIKDGRILDVGTSKNMRRLRRGPHTQVMDLKGGVFCPG